jgi:hypothetical protein
MKILGRGSLGMYGLDEVKAYPAITLAAIGQVISIL